MGYDIYDTSNSLFRSEVSLEEAAQLMQLDPHEIIWAIEEFGPCDTETYVVVGHGETSAVG